MTATCDDCGETFESDHGVRIHQSQNESCGSDDDWDAFEQRVVDRDEQCKKCNDADIDVVHKWKDDIKAEREIIGYAGLCQSCHNEIAGLASVTKKTLINQDRDDSDEDDKWYTDSPYRNGRGPRAGAPR